MSFNPFWSTPVASLILALGIFATAATGSGFNNLDVVSLVNKDRAAAGLNQVVVNDELTLAAYAKANEMVAHDLFDHYMPDGHTPWDFMLASGYDYAYAGENLAMGWHTAQAQHRAWMNSPTHRDNIMNPTYRDIGVAVLDTFLDGQPTTLVVQMFGAPLGPVDTLTAFLAEMLEV